MKIANEVSTALLRPLTFISRQRLDRLVDKGMVIVCTNRPYNISASGEWTVELNNEVTRECNSLGDGGMERTQETGKNICIRRLSWICIVYLSCYPGAYSLRKTLSGIVSGDEIHQIAKKALCLKPTILQSSSRSGNMEKPCSYRFLRVVTWLWSWFHLPGVQTHFPTGSCHAVEFRAWGLGRSFQIGGKHQ